jgi:hypothetical protein
MDEESTPAAPARVLAAPTGQPSYLDVRVLMVCLAGFCVFLNVYATQTLFPLFRRVFTASEFEVSLTVCATTVAQTCWRRATKR